jgi:ATP-dependent Clp protease adapter protein ClpS
MPTKSNKIENTETQTHVSDKPSVVLFDDQTHTFDEVIRQICLAIRCSIEHATELAEEVHNTGSSQVYRGDITECLQVSHILEKIRLKTQIQWPIEN